MKGIGPRFDYLIYDPARRSAVLSPVVVGEDLELFHRVGLGSTTALLPTKSLLSTPSIRKVSDSERCPLTENGFREPSSGSGGEDARLQQAQLKRIPFDQRQVNNAPLGFDRSQGRGDGVDLSDVSCNFHYLGLGADL